MAEPARGTRVNGKDTERSRPMHWDTIADTIVGAIEAHTEVPRCVAAVVLAAIRNSWIVQSGTVDRTTFVFALRDELDTYVTQRQNASSDGDCNVCGDVCDMDDELFEEVASTYSMMTCLNRGAPVMYSPEGNEHYCAECAVTDLHTNLSIISTADLAMPAISGDGTELTAAGQRLVVSAAEFAVRGGSYYHAATPEEVADYAANDAAEMLECLWPGCDDFRDLISYTLPCHVCATVLHQWTNERGDGRTSCPLCGDSLNESSHTDDHNVGVCDSCAKENRLCLFPDEDPYAWCPACVAKWWKARPYLAEFSDAQARSGNGTDSRELLQRIVDIDAVELLGFYATQPWLPELAEMVVKLSVAGTGIRDFVVKRSGLHALDETTNPELAIELVASLLANGIEWGDALQAAAELADSDTSQAYQ